MYLLILILVLIMLFYITKPKKINLIKFNCVEPEKCINARFSGYENNISYDYNYVCPANCIDKQKVIENRIIKKIECPNFQIYLND